MLIRATLVISNECLFEIFPFVIKLINQIMGFKKCLCENDMKYGFLKKNLTYKDNFMIET